MAVRLGPHEEQRAASPASLGAPSLTGTRSLPFTMALAPICVDDLHARR